MKYWNDENFDGLIAIAEEVAKNPELQSFAQYCQLRARGLRKKAFDSLDVFLRATIPLSLAQRQHVVAWLLDTDLRTPNVHQLLPFPLIEKLIKPTLAEWIESHPLAAAYRWHGYISGDADDFRQALKMDEKDVLARQFLIQQLLDWVGYTTHHLNESLFLVEESDALTALREVEFHLIKLPDNSLRDKFAAWFAEENQLVQDWIEYKADPEGTFPEWCQARNKMHDWGITIYYEK